MHDTYVVTRQIQWPEGKHVVEISAGGFDYTNPDALVAKYPGEFGEFCDPREALKNGRRRNMKSCASVTSAETSSRVINTVFTGSMQCFVLSIVPRKCTARSMERQKGLCK